MKQDHQEELPKIANLERLNQIEGSEVVDAGIEEVAETLDQEAEALLQENERAEQLLSSPDITDAEREEFKEELSALKEETISLRLSLRERVAKILGKAVKIAENIGSELKTAGKDIAEVAALHLERRKGVKAVDIILDGIKFENSEELKKEWLEQRKNQYISVAEPHFPINEDGLKIVRAIMKEKTPSIYDLKHLIEDANGIFDAMQKGISLETLQRIEQGRASYSLGDFLENPDSVEKLKVLDRMDFKDSNLSISLYDLKDISLEQLNLISSNSQVTFKWKDSGYIYSSDLIKHLTEENISKLKTFDSSITEIPIGEFIYFVKDISDLPAEAQEMCRDEYRKGKKMSGIASRETRDVLKNLDAKGAAKFKVLLEKGVVKFYSTYNLEAYLSLSEHIFDRCDYLKEDIKEVSVEHLTQLDTLSDEEFDLFKKIRKLSNNSYLGENITDFKRIHTQLGIVDSNILIDWFIKSDDRTNFEVHTQTQYLDRFKGIAEIVKSEPDIDLFDFISKAYGHMNLREALTGYHYDEGQSDLSRTASKLKESPETIISDILSKTEGIENTFTNFKDVQEILEKKNISFTDENISELFSKVISQKPSLLLESHSFPLLEEQRKIAIDVLIDTCPTELIEKYSLFEKEYLQYGDVKQETLDRLFEVCLEVNPLVFIDSKYFPFTPEQARYVEIFKRIQDSPSREMKNLSTEIAPLVAQYKTSEEANEALLKIEQIFLTNNIPLVGKQYKVFEILYPDERLSESVRGGKVESLKTLHNSSERRFTIFKDLMRAHIASADSNLEQYLLALKDGKEVLAKFESGDELNDTDKATIKLFFKKINVLSGHTGRESIDVGGEMSNEEISAELIDLKEAFGVREGEGLIEKFERTFLKRINIDSIEDALKLMEEYRNETTLRNERGASSGNVEIHEGDFVKNISSDYLDSYLDRGVYAPEFIGAESHDAKYKSSRSDLTPIDTDITRVSEEHNYSNVFISGYGDIMLVLKQKEQFKKDGLDVFKTGVIADSHYGIRTGFGSTEIDAIYVGEQQRSERKIDQLKYTIAKKGFYIPLLDSSGKVIFTKEDFDEHRKIFAGIDRFHGDKMEIKTPEAKNPEIESVAQTNENIENITKVRDVVMTRIQAILAEEGIVLHKGKYDDSLKGAMIADTGSTGRGSSLDEKFDFDFAIKLDDTDWGKVSSLMGKLGGIFPKADQYENKGMMMFRSNEVEIDGFKMTIDVGFNRKSDSEEFDAHDALKEKYDSIKENNGEQAYLDVLSNIRFAKKKLKEAGCYKKGAGADGREGGLGGIGVEYWILQNGGDAREAFRKFAEQAYKDGQLVPFEEFKKSYKVFSAGQNIRGAVKVENFTDNMAEDGYMKMAQLAREIK